MINELLDFLKSIPPSSAIFIIAGLSVYVAAQLAARKKSDNT